MSELKVSVCIPVANDWPHLYFTINQAAMLLVNSKLSHEIIVVENNSSEDFIRSSCKSIICAKDAAIAHNMRMYVSDTPSNGIAANEAAKHATGEYLAFMDSHVVLHPNIFEECIKVMENEKDVGMVHAPITWTGMPFEKDWSLSRGKRCYQYRYREGEPNGPWYLNAHFQGVYNHTLVSDSPYPIAGCGHL